MFKQSKVYIIKLSFPQNAKVNKAYDYKYYYSYKVVKGVKNISHFHNLMVLKLVNQH